MNHVTNTKLIARNAKIGQYTNLGALVVLGAGLFITFKWPDLFAYSLAALMLGFFLSQVGMYYGNRWTRKPRPDEVLDKSLKGLGKEYTLYHYVTPVPHLLLSPSGLWILLPYYLSGQVTFSNKRWRAKGGGFVQGYLRMFGQDSIGRPDLEAEANTEAVKKRLTKLLPEGTQLPPIQTALVFANPRAELAVEGAPLPAMLAKDLKDFFRKASKESAVGDLSLEAVRRVLPQATEDEE